MSIGLEAPAKGRVVSYIDGFNLYFGLRSSGLQRYLWLNVAELSSRLILPEVQVLTKTKYFTSRISGTGDKRKRQNDYLEALAYVCGSRLEMQFGHYQDGPHECRYCGRTAMIPHEKQTDVNIAVSLLSDAFSDVYDTAILVSADSDLSPAIRAVKAVAPTKKIVVAFPPNRYSVMLAGLADTSFTIGRSKFASAQLPDSVQTDSGITLKRPSKWQGAMPKSS